MLKQLATYALITLGVLILVISTLQEVTNNIASKRNTDRWYGHVRDESKGDLIRLGNLFYVDKFHSPPKYQYPKVTCNADKKTRLYLIGDSHTVLVPKKSYACIDSLVFSYKDAYTLTYNLDTSKNNILLFNITERLIERYFGDGALFRNLDSNRDKALYKVLFATQSAKTVRSFYTRAMAVCRWMFSNYFSQKTNSNIEYNLFDYKLLSFIKNSKAWLTYTLFKRGLGDIVISDNGNNLFIRETTSNEYSSYYKLSEGQIDIIAENINAINKYAISKGFNKVYLCIIPNPTTILQPTGYNDLIPKIHSKIEMKYLDLYSIFTKNPNKSLLYLAGDTHWSNKGLNIWIDELNDIITTQNNNKSLEQ